MDPPTTEDVVLPPLTRRPCVRVVLEGPTVSVAEVLRVTEAWCDLVLLVLVFTVGGDWSGVLSPSLIGLTLRDLGRVGDPGARCERDKLLDFQRVDEGVDLPEPEGESVVIRRRATSIGVSVERPCVPEAEANSPVFRAADFDIPCEVCCCFAVGGVCGVTWNGGS